MEPLADTEEGFVNSHHLEKIVMWEGSSGIIPKA